MHHATLVAYGYSQVAGVDFSENYFLVTSDIKFWALLLLIVYYVVTDMVVNVKTALLYLKLAEEMYMDFPPSVKYLGKDVTSFSKCIYGIVQAARQHNNTAVEILKKIGSPRQCWYMKQRTKGMVYVALYVDDTLVIDYLSWNVRF